MKKIFNLKESPKLYKGSNRVTSSDNVADLDGIILAIGSGSVVATCSEPACRVVYAAKGEDVSAIVCENPVGKNKLTNTQVFLFVFNVS